jgi:hypothetical protein
MTLLRFGTSLGVILVAARVTVIAADPEIAKLKESYDAAVERAVAPIKATYEKELRRVLERQTKAGNLAAANEANAELEALTGKSAGTVSNAKAATPKVNERWFVKHTWSTPGGTQFSFLEGGAAYRQYGEDKTAHIWKIDEDGLVVATTTAPGSQVCYFRFVSANEAYFGLSKEKMDQKLTLRK